MKTVGFFSNTFYALPGTPSLESVRGHLSIGGGEKSLLVAYLNAAPVAVRSLGTIAYDELDPERKRIGPHEIQTDGEWIWPSDLGYYVAQYDVALPEPLIDRIRQLGTAPSEIDDELIRRVEKHLFP